LIQVGGNFARIAAPPLAGLLLSWPLVGSGGTFFLIAALFILVLLTLYQLPPDAPRRAHSTSVLDDIRGGLLYTAGKPVLLHAVVSFHIVLILGFSFMVLMPGYATDELDAGASGYGVLLGVASAGGLITSVLVASLADSPRAQLFLSLSSLVAGLSLIAVGLAPGFGAALVAMLFVGAGTSAFQTLNNAYAMRLTEPAFYGRVIGLMFLAWGLINMIGLPIGVLADAVGERTVLVGLGICLCGAVGLLAVWGSHAYAGRLADAPAVGFRRLTFK
jgi:predicted MFS family arabinose efflux permease